ncbi:MAG TPA: A24 family peptidase, partial [Gemmatimonadales bacterium]|nr:A24 family peptidase [Gemmatimonadales bacterium]
IWAGAVAWQGVSVAALSVALFLTLLTGILVTDAQTMLIPDEFSLGGLGAGLLLALAPGGIGAADAAVGAAAGYSLLWLAGTVGRWWAGREAMGGGDLKMMAMVGAFIGWRGVLLTVFLGSLAGTLVYLPALIRRERYREVPFGIFLAVGAAIALVAGERLVSWYTSLLWPAP